MHYGYNVVISLVYQNFVPKPTEKNCLPGSDKKVKDFKIILKKKTNYVYIDD